MERTATPKLVGIGPKATSSPLIEKSFKRIPFPLKSQEDRSVEGSDLHVLKIQELQTGNPEIESES